MGEDIDFSPLADLPLDIDEQEPDRAFEQVIDDETLKLLRRANRVGVARGPTQRVSDPTLPPDRCGYDIPLLFVVHAHPECTFTWARFMIDVSATQDCVIADMSPREVDDQAVEIETTVGLGLSFSIAAKVADIGVKPELARKRTVYIPTVLTSGIGFRKAYWDFYPKGGDYLHADKECHLLLDAPANLPLRAALTVRAKVRFRGLPRLIPLLGRSAEAAAQLELA